MILLSMAMLLLCEAMDAVPRRPFLKLDTTPPATDTTTGSMPLRILQFNVLADGLSGLREDFGAFSRISGDGAEVKWEQRRDRLLAEITQYDADVICLQEVDHYYDFFFVEMLSRGYHGVYAPKPASACLEVSPRSDGCALFVRRTKLSIVSAETVTYALSTKNITQCPLLTPSIDSVMFTMRPQNQVAILAVCEVVNQKTSSSTSSSRDRPTPAVIIATTHLKAAKNAVGELYRFNEAEQLLAAVHKARENLLVTEGAGAAVILAGDFNCKPCGGEDYPALTYERLKSHPLELRSVYNDNIVVGVDPAASERRSASPGPGLAYDSRSSRFYEYGARNQSSSSSFATVGGGSVRATESPSVSVLQQRSVAISSEGLYTTWKARCKRGKEKVSKHCIDYIFYSPTPLTAYRPAATRARLRATALLDVFSAAEVGAALLPSALYPSDHLAIAADLQLEWD